LDYFAKKEQLSFQTVKLGALAEYKFKGRTFPFKAEYLHELIWESGNTGWTKKIFHLKTSLSLLMI
jgi:hypothetical protein